MTEEHLKELWKRVESVGDVNNLDYGAMVTLGSVFGEMSSRLLFLEKEVVSLKRLVGEIEEEDPK